MLSTVILTWVATAWWIERYGRRPLASGDRFDAIVVPGCRVLEDGRPSSAFSRRIHAAIDLYQEGRASALIFCGGVGDAPFAESEVARDIAVQRGVPAAAIWTESASTTTETNAAHAARAFEAVGTSMVLVVTDAFHVWRSTRVFARHFGAARGFGVIHPSRRLRAKGALREVWAVLGYGVLRRL